MANRNINEKDKRLIEGFRNSDLSVLEVYNLSLQIYEY